MQQITAQNNEKLMQPAVAADLRRHTCRDPGASARELLKILHGTCAGVWPCIQRHIDEQARYPIIDKTMIYSRFNYAEHIVNLYLTFEPPHNPEWQR